jgi:hypothetical protein
MPAKNLLKKYAYISANRVFLGAINIQRLSIKIQSPCFVLRDMTRDLNFSPLLFCFDSFFKVTSVTVSN